MGKKKTKKKDMHKHQKIFAENLRSLIDTYKGELDLDHMISALEFAKFNLMCVAREQALCQGVMPELSKIQMPEITSIAEGIVKGITKKK